MEQLPDDELMRLTPSRPEAFGVLYRRHERVVLAYLRRRSGDAELAADLAAETFAAALHGAARYRGGREPAVAWLLGIARNKAREAGRRGRVEDRARRRLGMEPLVVDDAMRERIDALAAGAVVDELLAALPADQAEAIRARIVDERPYDEIAAAMLLALRDPQAREPRARDAADGGRGPR